MAPRFAPILSASFALLVVAACTGTAVVGPATPAPSTQVPSPGALPTPTPVPTPVVMPTPTPSQNAGDVDGFGPGPELTIEFLREDLLEVALEDPQAKAWRLVVAGAGSLSQDRWEIVVETGDIAPSITATEIQQGEVVGVLDLSGYVDGTAVTGGCHATLDVCLDSSGFGLPVAGNGRLAIRLQMPGESTPLVLTGGSAGWPGEPFILGPWSETEPFPWGEG